MVSEAASIATLVLFVMYFIGRIITIFSVRRMWTDEIVFDQKRFGDYGIVDEVGDMENRIFGLLVTNTGIRKLKIYKPALNSEGLPLDNGEQLYSRDFLNVHQAIAVREMTGDLFPALIIEYLTADYMEVRLEWRDNLKNGVYSELVEPRHTGKSILYYLCR